MVKTSKKAMSGNATAKGNGDDAAKTDKGLSGKTVALILGVTLIIAITTVVIVLLLKDKPADNMMANTGTGALFYDDSNMASVEEELREKVAKGMFTTHMNTTWVFPDGESASIDAVMGNSSANNYPFWFDVTVDGEVVHESSIIPVGSQIKEIVLSKNLAAGTYDAVVMVHMIDENNEPVENNMGINITLVVQK